MPMVLLFIIAVIRFILIIMISNYYQSNQKRLSDFFVLAIGQYSYDKEKLHESAAIGKIE